ncbi:MAG: DUF2339 domain-containing protein, partial [Chloroflexi bacterium]|nr:DUF2339 domain-containing protein [Chloroflexota bacterium]
ALIFLFSYAVEQGWLTPAVRVVIGLLVATTLLFFGLRLYESRRAFSVVLLGGSMGSYYITGFAAFQLYDLVPYAFAFGFMVLVTLLTFFLSLRQDEAVLSLIGTFGGLLTPILLDTGSGNIEGLLLYSCLVIGGVAAIYFFRGWRILLWFVWTGAWMIIFYSLGEANSQFNTITVTPWIMQFSILFALFVFWVLPVLRHLLVSSSSRDWHPLSLGFADKYLPDLIKRWLNIDLHVFTFTTVLLASFTTQGVWDISNTPRGWIFIGAAVIVAAVALYLSTLPQHLNLSITHVFTSTTLLTIGFLVLLDGEALFIAIVLEAIAWHFFSSRLRKIVVSVGTHIFSFVLGIWLLVRLFNIDVGSAETAVRILTDLFVMGSFAGIAFAWLSITGKRIYLIAIHVAVLLLLWRELNELDNGQALISIAWGVYAVTLLIIGLRGNRNVVRMVGLVTLFVLVGKLFIVDLENVKAIWRILLFFGFGGLFLLLSYFYQGLWKSDDVVVEAGE